VSPVPIPPWIGIRLASPLTYGASGSPVCNSRGEVVAVIWAGDQKDNRMGFAVPAARLASLTARQPYPLAQINVSEPLDTNILVTSSAPSAPAQK